MGKTNFIFASSSRSHIISLNSKLVKNPKGSRSIAEILQDMRSIADDIALAQSPITEEDLMVHIISQFGVEYNIVAAIKVRDSPLSFSELFDKLQDYERAFKEHYSTAESPITTVKHNSTTRSYGLSKSFSNRNNKYQWYGTNTQPQWSGNIASGNYCNNKNNTFCRFCNILGPLT